MNEVQPFGEELSPKSLKRLLDFQTIVLIGGGKGDEGKGGDAFALAEHGDYQLIVGPVGGANAGHTAINDKGEKFVGHNLPGSALSGKPVFLGQGKYVNITGLDKEVGELYKITKQKPKISIASGAHVILKSIHIKIDNGIEESRSQKVGTTGSGMGPVVATRALRTGLTMGQLLTLEGANLVKFAHELADPWNTYYAINPDEVIAEITQEQSKIKELIREGIVDIVGDDFAKEAFHAGDKLLVEGSQSPSLGMFGGAYPNNTSTDTSFLGILSSVGIMPIPGRVAQLLIVKAFPSAVGTHEFPERVSHIFPELAEKEAAFGLETRERGATTGRARMIAFPSPALVAKQVRDSAPYTAGVSVRKLDVVPQFRDMVMDGKPIPVVTRYWNGSGEPHLGDRVETAAELVEIYRRAILGASGGKDITLIGGFGPEPRNSRVL